MDCPENYRQSLSNGLHEIPFPSCSDFLSTVSCVSVAPWGSLNTQGHCCPDLLCSLFKVTLVSQCGRYSRLTLPTTRKSSLELWASTPKVCHAFLPTLLIPTMLISIWLWYHWLTGLHRSPLCLPSISPRRNSTTSKICTPFGITWAPQTAPSLQQIEGVWWSLLNKWVWCNNLTQWMLENVDLCVYLYSQNFIVSWPSYLIICLCKQESSFVSSSF